MHYLILISLVLLYVKMICFNVNAYYSTLIFNCEYPQHHPLPKFFRLHCQVDAWSDHFSYLSL